MLNLNKVILAGNTTADPDFRVSPKGTSMCAMRMATNIKYKKQDGESSDIVTYVNVKMFGGTADFVNKYITKGQNVLVEGQLRLDQWEDKKTGDKRSQLYVLANSVQAVKKDEQKRQQPQDENDEDIPF